MPREVADALKAQGRWQEGKGMVDKPAAVAPQATTAPDTKTAAGDKTLGQRSER
jgi:cytochrome c-type biogenesis protein CcmE